VSAAARRPARAVRPRASREPRPGGARRERWWVYLLRCRDGSLYAGATNDLRRRLAAHARGRAARYTRSRLPVALVHCEPADGRGSALRREAALKRLTRAQKLALVARSRRRGPSVR
jgi:putative endonuclease